MKTKGMFLTRNQISGLKDFVNSLFIPIINAYTYKNGNKHGIDRSNNTIPIADLETIQYLQEK